MNKFKKILVIALVFASFSGCTQNRLYKDRKFILGTVVEIISPYPEAADIAFREMKRVEGIFSIFISDSAISHLNKTGFLNTNFEVASLIKEAQIFYMLTKGKFDITVGPLTKIWREAIKENSLPDGNEIKRKIKLVGFDKIFVDRKNNSIKLKMEGMQVDLGAIAKGYAVDCAVNELKRKGIDSAIVNAGGNLYCLGSKFGKPWQIGLQHPRKRGVIIKTLELKDLAVSTSGDYQQYMEVKGKRYSHIINPKTGYPIENNVVSVTVVAKDATIADAVSTSVFLLGRDKGIKVFKNFEGVKKIYVITQSNAESN